LLVLTLSVMYKRVSEDESTNSLHIELLVTLVSKFEFLIDNLFISEKKQKDLIRHKIQFKLVPFLDFAKPAAILSNGDSFPIPPGL